MEAPGGPQQIDIALIDRFQGWDQVAWSARGVMDSDDDENVYSFNLDFGDAIHIILLGISLFFVIAAVRRCVMCILPRFNFTVKKSPLFFGDINKYKDFDTFFESL